MLLIFGAIEQDSNASFVNICYHPLKKDVSVLTDTSNKQFRTALCTTENLLWYVSCPPIGKMSCPVHLYFASAGLSPYLQYNTFILNCKANFSLH